MAMKIILLDQDENQVEKLLILLCHLCGKKFWGCSTSGSRKFMGSSKSLKPSKSSKTFRSRHDFDDLDGFDVFDEALRLQ